MKPLLRHALSDAERRLAELQLWALSEGASCWIIDLEPYETCRLGGVIERLTLDPVEGHLDASVTDGTDRVIARWAIRPSTPQTVCVPRRLIVIEGVAIAGDDNLMLVEPRFEIITRQVA